MNKKNKIENFINQYRKSKATVILLQRCFYTLIFIILMFTIFAFLEQLVYFNSDNRIRILILIASFVLSFLIVIGGQFLFQLNGKIKNFTNKDMAKHIGKKNDSLSDKLINAYELNNTPLESKLSEQLKIEPLKMFKE